MEIYSKTIAKGDDFQIRLTVSEWNDIEYLHLRKYYLTFEETWMPTKDGVSMPLDLENISLLFGALVELLAGAESKELLEEYFKETLDDLYKK